VSFTVLAVTSALFSVACGAPAEEPTEPSTLTASLEEEASVQEGDDERRRLCERGRGVRYVSRDPAQCAAIFFICQPGEVAFFNECGCGCKPAPTP
jgi:hypothetical protein